MRAVRLGRRRRSLVIFGLVMVIVLSAVVIVRVVTNSPNVIRASGTKLTLNGSAYRFTGLNAYESATVWGVNAGCGGDLSKAQLNTMFASLPPDSLVRFWAFQGTLATSVQTGRIVWGPIDRVFAAAQAHGQRLIPVITDQGGTCDGGHWEDPGWYLDGFKRVYNNPETTDGTGREHLSYWSYLQKIVRRYRNSPALGMWEPISEAEASTCPTLYLPTNCSGHVTCPSETAAAHALRHFFDAVGAEIHSLDPNHLVESGLLGGGQCGIVNGDYKYVSASPGIDVLAYHDYYSSSPPGSSNWRSLETRILQARSLNKPIIAGEVGIKAGPGTGCMNRSTRNAEIESKMSALIRAGGSGSLVWDWTPVAASSCSFDVGPSDPMMQAGGAVG
jgi:mannan endo-1,4-beta-mannosidase